MRDFWKEHEEKVIFKLVRLGGHFGKEGEWERGCRRQQGQDMPRLGARRERRLSGM